MNLDTSRCLSSFTYNRRRPQHPSPVLNRCTRTHQCRGPQQLQSCRGGLRATGSFSSASFRTQPTSSKTKNGGFQLTAAFARPPRHLRLRTAPRFCTPPACGLYVLRFYMFPHPPPTSFHPPPPLSSSNTTHTSTTPQANPSASATDAMRAAAFGSSVLDPQTYDHFSPHPPSLPSRSPPHMHACTPTPLPANHTGGP